MEKVKINRRFVSTHSGLMCDAVSDAAWSELLTRIQAVSPLFVEEFNSDRGEGVVVTVENHRGTGGALALHDVACRYGAPVVVLS